MKPDRADAPYPDAAEFAAFVASRKGLQRIVDAGLAWTPELAIEQPAFAVSSVSTPGTVAVPSRYPCGGIIDLATAAGQATQASPAQTALLATGPHEALCGPSGVLLGLSDLVIASPLVVVATDEPAPVLARLESLGLRPEFVGQTRIGSGDQDRSGHLMVVDRELSDAVREAPEPPESFRVVALMSVYNEEDLVGPSIEKLVGDSVGVYVIDNWSTDRTAEIVRGFAGRGLVGFEQFPSAPSGRFELRALLEREAEVAATLQADWCIHHDADERRCGPWPGVGLRRALWRVDRAGYSAVDHTVLNYRPVDDDFRPGSDFEQHMRHFEFGRTSDMMLQIKAWKNVGRVDLAGTGGHEATFPGRRVFPYRFLLKHYPIRSQAHGERKVFRERVARWDPAERARGWHNHYDGVATQQSFLRHPSELIEDRGDETRRRYMPEMLAGAGLAERRIPGWALGGATRRALYFRSRPLVRTGLYQAVRRLVVLPHALLRGRRDPHGRAH
jgi:glycosyltransferase involved in cell wall biosynthesis